MIRSVWIILAASVVTFGCSVAAIISGLINPYSSSTNGVIRFWSKTLLKIAGIDVEITGITNLKDGQPYIFMSNHQSTFDIMSCLAYVPGTARFLAKKELFRIPVFAQGMRAAGMIPVDRGNSKKARESIDQAVSEVKKGVSVIIFPEGTRTRDGNIQSFKKGGFVLAIKGGIPIAPIVLSGAREVMQKKEIRLQKGSIKLEFLKPVATEDYGLEQRDNLVKLVRDQIVERYEAIQ